MMQPISMREKLKVNEHVEALAQKSFHCFSALQAMCIA